MNGTCPHDGFPIDAVTDWHFDCPAGRQTYSDGSLDWPLLFGHLCYRTGEYRAYCPACDTVWTGASRFDAVKAANP